MKNFAELADLMEPEWNVKHITTTWPKEPVEVVVELFKRESFWFTWEILRRIPLQFAKFTASGTGDTQTIHITLEPKP